MRIRQVKPAFWTDARVAAWPPSVRLFYIGLWMQADDAGWFRCDVPQIANELYGYEPRGRRERNVSAFLDALTAADRVTILPCGHAEVLKLTAHQHQAVMSKRVTTIQREHLDTCGSPTIPVGTRGNLPLPASKGKGSVKGNGDGNGQVGKGNGSAPANAPDGAGATIDDPNVPPFLRAVQ